MSVDLNRFGLGKLASYTFQENNDDTNIVRYNVKKNNELLAVEKDKNGNYSLTVIKKADLTFKNKIKALFNRGALANKKYDFYSVGNFVQERVMAIGEMAKKRIDDVEGAVPFEKKVEKFEFEGEGKEKIIENIYAIANRMIFSASHKHAGQEKLFNYVSAVPQNLPQIFDGNAAKEISGLRYNQGLNGRFLALQIKRKIPILGTEVEISKEGKTLNLTDKLSESDFGKLSVKFK